MKHASYLKHLKFNPKLSDSIQARYLRNPRLLILLLLVVVTLGAYSYGNIPHRLNPEIKIPLVVVSSVLPGASPNDMESLVTSPLEDSIGGIENIKTYTSTSQDSVSVIQVEFNTGTDVDKATNDVKNAVDGADLPTDAQKPKVAKIDFEQFPVWSFSLTSKNGDSASLISLSKQLKDRLEALPTVKNVTLSGLEEEEIQVLLKPEAISTYGVNPQSLIAALSTATKSLPAGTLRTESSSFTLSIDPSVTSAQDVRNLKLNLNGQVVNLSDIAIVAQKSKPAQAQSFVAKNGETPRQAVSFGIFKTENANIDQTVTDSRKEIDSVLNQYNGQFNLFTTSDVSKQIDDQFNELIRDFILTVSLVFIALLVFLGIRQAVVASISIPLTFLISFTLMNVFGIALSFISFFSLLLALGLLVDDTIVVISAMTSYYRSGKFTPEQTGLLVWRDFILPIITTTLTTVWAFIPLLLSGGIIGEFIKPIPIVVSATLLASFFVAMFITLPVITYLLKPSVPRRVKVFFTALLIIALFGILISVSGKGPLLLPEIIILASTLFILFKLRNLYSSRFRERVSTPLNKYKEYVNHGLLSFEGISIRYQGLIKRILSSGRWLKVTIVIVVIFSIFSYLLVPVGLVKNEFFPKTDADQVFVSVELPPGTNIQTSKREALFVFNKLQNSPEVSTVSLDLGQTSGQFGGGAPSASNNFLFTLVLNDKRKLDSSEISEKIREEFKDYSKGKFSVVEESGGPPAGADVQIKILGSDLGVLDNYANSIQKYLESQPGITNVDKSIKPGTSKITFIPDQEKLSENGVSIDQVAFTMRTFASGFKLADLKFDPTSTTQNDITLRFATDTEFAENINSLLITTPEGITIPLTSLGQLELKSSPTLITREDGDRTISVTATVKKGYSVQTTNTNLEQYAKKLDLPTGYIWKTGGVNEENQSSVNSILTAMVLSFLLILVTMVLQFSSFRKALIVILVIPLSISGVFIIFALTNTPLSFPALIGVLALFGIVVKNSILIVDKIQANERTENMEFKEGIAEGAASRLEPIALTSLTAILGLIPITLSDPLWRGLGGAIVAGLVFSGTIMLFFIPVVYYLAFKPSAQRSGRSSQRS